jgi:hypothetical protein
MPPEGSSSSSNKGKQPESTTTWSYEPLMLTQEHLQVADNDRTATGSTSKSNEFPAGHSLGDNLDPYQIDSSDNSENDVSSIVRTAKTNARQRNKVGSYRDVPVDENSDEFQ